MPGLPFEAVHITILNRRYKNIMNSDSDINVNKHLYYMMIKRINQSTESALLVEIRKTLQSCKCDIHSNINYLVFQVQVYK